MSSIIKQSLKTSAINYIGILLGAFFSLYLAPKYLTTEYNGLYRLIVEYAAVAAAYFHFGVPTIINRYYHRIFSEGKISKGFDFFIFGLPLLLILTASIFIIFFRSELTAHISSKESYEIAYRYILFIIPVLFSQAYFLILEAYSAMLGNIVFVNFCKNVLIKVCNIISILIYVLTHNFSIAMSFIAIGSSLCVIAVFIKVLQYKKFKIDFSISSAFLKSNGLSKDFLKYIGYLIIGNLTVFLVSKIDIFFVGSFTNLSSVAFYTTAGFFVTLLLVPYQAVLNISFPQISRALHLNTDRNELNELITGNAIYAFSLSLFTFLMVWINIDTIYKFMPNGELYIAGKYVFLILGIGKLIDISIGSIGQVLTVSKWYIYTLYYSIFISIVSIILGYFLTKRYGIYGAAISISICTLLSDIYQVGVIKIKLKVFPYDRRNIIFLGVIPLMLLLSKAVDVFVHNPFVNLTIKGVLGTICFFGYMEVFSISKEITTILQTCNQRILGILRK